MSLNSMRHSSGQLQLSALEVRYTRDVISPRFQDGRELKELFWDLVQSHKGCNNYNVPMITVQRDVAGMYWCIDGNRRLYVFQVLAKLRIIDTIPVSLVTHELTCIRTGGQNVTVSGYWDEQYDAQLINGYSNSICANLQMAQQNRDNNESEARNLDEDTKGSCQETDGDQSQSNSSHPQPVPRNDSQGLKAMMMILPLCFYNMITHVCHLMMWILQIMGQWEVDAKERQMLENARSIIAGAKQWRKLKIELPLRVVRYSHDVISPCFQNGTEIAELFWELIESRSRFDDVPLITVVQDQGLFWCTNGNRRLLVYKTLNKLGIMDGVPVLLEQMNTERFEHGEMAVTVRGFQTGEYEKRLITRYKETHRWPHRRLLERYVFNALLILIIIVPFCNWIFFT